LCELEREFGIELMAENVSLFHRRDIAAVDMQVGTADGGRGDFDDGVAGVQDFGVRNAFNPNIFFSIVTDSFHRGSFRPAGP
jgi:hypothetical protein